jgi:hypothetical protein
MRPPIPQRNRSSALSEQLAVILAFPLENSHISILPITGQEYSPSSAHRILPVFGFSYERDQVPLRPRASRGWSGPDARRGASRRSGARAPAGRPRSPARRSRAAAGHRRHVFAGRGLASAGKSVPGCRPKPPAGETIPLWYNCRHCTSFCPKVSTPGPKSSRIGP